MSKIIDVPLSKRLRSTKFIGFAFLVLVATGSALAGLMPWDTWSIACGGFYVTFVGANVAQKHSHNTRRGAPDGEVERIH